MLRENVVDLLGVHGVLLCQSPVTQHSLGDKTDLDGELRSRLHVRSELKQVQGMLYGLQAESLRSSQPYMPGFL